MDHLIAEMRYFDSSSELFCVGETGVPSLLHHTLPLSSPQQLATAESQNRALPIRKCCTVVLMWWSQHTGWHFSVEFAQEYDGHITTVKDRVP